MKTERRSFLKVAGAVGLGSVTLPGCQPAEIESKGAEDPFAGLTPMIGDIEPIEKGDFEARHERARALMKKEGIDCLFLSGTNNLYYFSGIRMGGRDRLFAMFLPQEGSPSFVCPAFELARAKESIKYGEEDVRTWDEHDDPFKLGAEILREKGLEKSVIGVDVDLPFWYYDALSKAAPQATYRNAGVVTYMLRMVKSTKEIALIRRAVEISMKAYKAAFETTYEGMSSNELKKNIALAISKLGGGENHYLKVSFGPASSFPHGSKIKYPLKEGTVILVDGSSKVDNYPSDISRTIVFGTPSEKVVKVWETVRKAQLAAIEVIRPGVACQEVDRAARRVVEEAGFGPGYKYFFHRLGHGQGMDGHEHPYMVEGNTFVLKPGICFTVEPGIYIPGEFGVRLEDDVVVTDDGCEVLGNSMSTAIDKPFG